MQSLKDRLFVNRFSRDMLAKQLFELELSQGNVNRANEIRSATLHSKFELSEMVEFFTESTLNELGLNKTLSKTSAHTLGMMCDLIVGIQLAKKRGILLGMGVSIARKVVTPLLESQKHT